VEHSIFILCTISFFAPFTSHHTSTVTTYTTSQRKYLTRSPFTGVIEANVSETVRLSDLHKVRMFHFLLQHTVILVLLLMCTRYVGYFDDDDDDDDESMKLVSAHSSV